MHSFTRPPPLLVLLHSGKPVTSARTCHAAALLRRTTPGECK